MTWAEQRVLVWWYLGSLFGYFKETSHILEFDSFRGMGSCLLLLCCS